MTTTVVEPVFVDTNVLISANLATAPRHPAALQMLRDLEGQGVELWISRQVVREYLATLSRPQAYAAPQPMTTLVTQVGYFLTRFLIAEDGPGVTTHLLALLSTIPTGGKQVHDANIVATMQAHGIRRLLTHNVTDFARFAARIDILPL